MQWEQEVLNFILYLSPGSLFHPEGCSLSAFQLSAGICWLTLPAQASRAESLFAVCAVSLRWIYRDIQKSTITLHCTCSNITWVLQVLQSYLYHSSLRKGRGPVLPSKLSKVLLRKLKESGKYSSKTQLNPKASRLTFSKVTVSFRQHQGLT